MSLPKWPEGMFGGPIDTELGISSDTTEERFITRGGTAMHEDGYEIAREEAAARALLKAQGHTATDRDAPPGYPNTPRPPQRRERDAADALGIERDHRSGTHAPKCGACLKGVSVWVRGLGLCSSCAQEAAAVLRHYALTRGPGS
jgi:hypothetical protein